MSLSSGRILHTTKQEDPHWSATVVDYRHLTEAELAEHDALRAPDDQETFADGFSFKSIMIDSPVYNQWLLRRFCDAGGVIEQRLVESLETLVWPHGKNEKHNLVVNCAGLAASQLCDDKHVFPVRGQTVRVTAPAVDRFLVIESGKHSLSYILPRGNGQVVLGGTVEPNNWSSRNEQQQVGTIMHRCLQFVPALREPEVRQSAQPWAGLRPGRSAEVGGVRLEVDQNCPWLIHNYGHGGSGMTLSWGCAKHVLRLVMEIQQHTSKAKL